MVTGSIPVGGTMEYTIKVDTKRIKTQAYISGNEKGIVLVFPNVDRMSIDNNETFTVDYKSCGSNYSVAHNPLGTLNIEVDFNDIIFLDT